MVAWSKFLESPKVQKTLMVGSLGICCMSTLKALTWRMKSTGPTTSGFTVEEKKKVKAAVDGQFLKRIARILKILIPGVFSKEVGYMILIAVSLIVRTFCDVWMIAQTTGIERTIISRDPNLFKKALLGYMTSLPLIAIVTQVMKWGISELKLQFRERLTMGLENQYLSGFTYYRINNMDNRISNPDQLLTQDIDKFCDSVVDLYSNLTKPILDITMYVKTLISTTGASTPAIMIGYLILSGAVLTRLRRPVGKMTMQQQNLEGEFRYINSRVITNSEEIAFYQGNEREKLSVKRSFTKLVDHLRDQINFRFAIGVVDNIIAKYFATVVGFCSVAINFIYNKDRHSGMSQVELMEDYYLTGRMVMRMAESLGRIALAGREMTRLAGFTARVTQLMDVLEDLDKGKYVRTIVNTKELTDEESTEEAKEKLDLSKRGTIHQKDNVIEFNDVPLVTPNGDVLLRKLNFQVESGKNVLVCGPNGCGKSSLFRVLGELWPLFDGEMTKPKAGKLFYVPQRPYMTLGTLRDQIIYPDTIGHMKRKGITEDQLFEFLNKVHLGYILQREGGWDSTRDWIDVLSGGEKQRVAMARLFYHKPQFAILDECTSAVSVDVEGYMYTHCREIGITLFTVSHRKSLWKYHEYVLYMDGRGSYEFNPIEESTTEFGS